MRPKGIHTKGWKWSQPRTHCQRGHEFTEENTGIQTPSGKRFCRACDSERRAKGRERPGWRKHQSEKMAQWRAANPERNKRNWTENRKRKHQWLVAFKQSLGCVMCPETHEACLEFHHVDPTQKDVTVSIAIAHWSLERIQEEIKKCVVLCSNCHRKWHWDERRANRGERT